MQKYLQKSMRKFYFISYLCSIDTTNLNLFYQLIKKPKLYEKIKHSIFPCIAADGSIGDESANVHGCVNL